MNKPSKRLVHRLAVPAIAGFGGAAVFMVNAPLPVGNTTGYNASLYCTSTPNPGGKISREAFDRLQELRLPQNFDTIGRLMGGQYCLANQTTMTDPTTGRSEQVWQYIVLFDWDEANGLVLRHRQSDRKLIDWDYYIGGNPTAQPDSRFFPRQLSSIPAAVQQRTSQVADCLR